MQISRWGNSLAVRLPAALVRDLGLKDGDEIDLVAVSAVSDAVKLAIQPRQSRSEIVQGLRRFEGRLPRSFRFDRDEANRR